MSQDDHFPTRSGQLLRLIAACRDPRLAGVFCGIGRELRLPITLFKEVAMTRFVQILAMTLLTLMPGLVLAGPAQDANAVLDRWSAAYTSNDPEAVVRNYWPDAIVLGTISPFMSEGTEAIRTYFSPLKGSGNKVVIGERRMIVLDDNAVLFAGFYEFTRMQEGKPVPGPSRFTLLVVKRGDEWRIAHHHSSPQVQP
jgi:uncharacterized protein (TIGR02246 family)